MQLVVDFRHQFVIASSVESAYAHLTLPEYCQIIPVYYFWPVVKTK